MSLSRFRCKVKFLSTLSIFPHQSDCQNISSPLHLSVLEHLSIVLSYLFYIAVSHLYIQHLNWIIGLTSKNSTTLLSTNIINNWRHALKTAKIKVYRWSWLLSHAKQLLKPMSGSGTVVAAYIMVAEMWNQKRLYIGPSKLLFVHFKATSFFSQPKRSCFLSPLLVNSIVIFLAKKVPEEEFQVP